MFVEKLIRIESSNCCSKTSQKTHLKQLTPNKLSFIETLAKNVCFWGMFSVKFNLSATKLRIKATVFKAGNVTFLMI